MTDPNPNASTRQIVELYQSLPAAWNARPSKNAVQIMVARESGGRWRVESFQNTPAAFHGRPELVAELTEELRQVMARPHTGN